MVERVAAGEAALAEPPVDIPPGHLCARCGYPSGRSGSRVCPECGWAATAADLRAELTRREAAARWLGGQRSRHAARWVAVALVYSLGAGVVVRSVGALTGSLVAMLLGVAATWQFGRWGAWRCRRDRREYLGVVWARSLWLLHLPWLVSPLFVLVALFVGLIDLWAGQGGRGAYHWAVVAGFFLWLIGCVAAFIIWWRRRLVAVAAGGYRPGRADAVAFLLGGVVAAGATGLGFVAGLATAVGVARWLGLTEFLWD